MMHVGTACLIEQDSIGGWLSMRIKVVSRINFPCLCS
jgi:hypothetical protein